MMLLSDLPYRALCPSSNIMRHGVTAEGELMAAQSTALASRFRRVALYQSVPWWYGGCHPDTRE